MKALLLRRKPTKVMKIHNQNTWNDLLRDTAIEEGPVSWEDAVDACKDHRNGTGRGFLLYLCRIGILEQVNVDEDGLITGPAEARPYYEVRIEELEKELEKAHKELGRIYMKMGARCDR